jgi:TolB-like protein/class 3 adenylate cyclase
MAPLSVAHLDRRLLAILAADVVGYSKAMEADEAGTIARLRAARAELTDPLVAAHHGRIVELMGDGAIVAFESVVDAVACAVAVQRGMAERNAGLPEAQRIVFRIAVNLGDVALVDGDVYGDGVNVAARLQQLADPGGVIVSGTAYDHLQGKLDLPLDDAGEQHVKNIARPVRAYRVRLDGVRARRSILQVAGLGRHPGLVAAILLFLAVLGGGIWRLWPQEPVIDEPSIAVLPFVNLSGDPTQDYLGAGIAEDIITLLSTFPGMRVISRTSSFAYDKPIKVQEIASDLGVRYVLEGSVRQIGDEVRVIAQLIDARSGDHVWANRYEEQGADVFALQEEVADRIYSSLAGIRGEVRRDEEQHAWAKAAPSLGEYDYYLRGHQLFMRFNAADELRAKQIWEEGLAKFPASSLLRTKLAFFYLRHVMLGRSDNVQRDIETGWKLGTEAAALEHKSRFATWLNHWLMAFYFQLHGGDFERSVAEAEAAVQMVPYDAFVRGDLAALLANAGRTDQAIAWAQEATRRDPNMPEDFTYGSLAWAYYLANRPREALAELERMRNPPELTQAAVYSRLGRLDEARAVIARYLEGRPGYTLQDEAFRPVKEPLKQAYLDDLRKAGLPEG